MRLRRHLAHILLHFVPLSSFAHHGKKLSDGDESGKSAGQCPLHEPCFDEDTRIVPIR